MPLVDGIVERGKNWWLSLRSLQGRYRVRVLSSLQVQLRHAWEGRNRKGELCDKCVTWICHGRYVFFVSRVRDHLGEIPFSSGFLAALYVVCSACIKTISKDNDIDTICTIIAVRRKEIRIRSPIPSPWLQVQTPTYIPPSSNQWSQKTAPNLVRKGLVYIRQFSVLRILHTMTIVCSVPLSYSIHDLPTFVNKSGINIINLTFTTPRLWWCRNMTMDIVWILNSRRCFTQYNNHRVQTPDMSHSLTIVSLLATTLGLSSLPKFLGSLQFRMPRPLTSDTLQSDGYLVRHPMTIRIPDHLEFQWIMIMVITGPLLWTPVHIQKPLLHLLNRVHHPKTHARRHRLLS